jgi:hypothetical protein
LWWVIFDTFLNVLRGKKVFYVGYTDVFDRSIRWISKVLHVRQVELVGLLLKLILIIVVAIL